MDFAQQRPMAFALNCYLNSNRANLMETPTMDFHMKEKYSKLQNSHDYRLRGSSMDGEIQFETIPKISQSGYQTINSRSSTRARSKMSVDSRMQLRSLQQNGNLIKEYSKPKTPPKATESPPRLRSRSEWPTSLNEISAISNQLLKDQQEDIMHKRDQELRELRFSANSVRHREKFKRFNKINHPPNEIPSVVRMAKSVDVPTLNQPVPQQAWVSFAKVPRQQKTFLPQEPFQEPIPTFFAVFRGAPFEQKKRRPWLWFRPTKPHDRNKHFGEDVSFADQSKYF